MVTVQHVYFNNVANDADVNCIREMRY